MTTPLPDALLLITAGCAHCPVTLDALTRLTKEGTIGRLEVVNVAAHPEVAEAHGVRSVPWTLLGEFELEGALTHEELRQWAQRARTPGGMADYLAHLLKSGQLARCVRFATVKPNRLNVLIALLADADTDLTIRIGVNAVLEELRGSTVLTEATDALGALTRHSHPAVRADACHALSFTSRNAARPYLESCLTDTDANVREIAAESLENL